MAERTPWARLLSHALALGVPPAVFWRLSLKEWRALNAARDEALNRVAFDALAARYPDKRT